MLDIFKKAADTVKSTAEGARDAAKIYSQFQKEKKKLKESEDKIYSLYAELGSMVFSDSSKESVFLDVNYRMKINVIIGEKEKIKDIERKINDVNKLL